MSEAHDDDSGWGSLADELGLDESTATTPTHAAKHEAPEDETEGESDGNGIGEAPELLEEESEAASPLGENGEPAPGGKKKRRRRRRGKKKDGTEAPANGTEGAAPSSESESDESDEGGDEEDGDEPVSAMDEENVQKPSFANVVAWKDLVATLHRPH